MRGLRLALKKTEQGNMCLHALISKVKNVPDIDDKTLARLHCILKSVSSFGEKGFRL
jgi:hypothetical protein